MLDSWLPFLIYGLVAVVVPGALMGMAVKFWQRPASRRWMSLKYTHGPAPRTRAGRVPFESGVSTGPLPRQRFSVSFYLTAMLFIVFDIEIVFLYPLAVQLHALGWFGFAELAFFIVIL